ncbi:MAG: hypothetical protein ACI9QN_001730 [Arcticibacterium sp.]|jgi:hypothetical protein
MFKLLNIISKSLTALAISMLIYSCDVDLSPDLTEAVALLPEDLDYNIHVKPILSDKCFACHGPDQAKQKAGLRLDISETAYAELPESPGKVAIDPGSLNGSEVFHRITASDPDFVMPTPESHLSLSIYEKAVLIKWMKDGAEYKPHWAFVKPTISKTPKVSDETWPQNRIDNFILAKLDELKLNPSQRAKKETLLRRVTFDLTGLPPNPAEVDAFLVDANSNAFEKVVDRLMESPHYGERMTADWLDLARFADSHGYTVDRIRDMSPYRDWVIKAFNENQPYDQFVHWQLAGDLMPSPSKEMIIATAFNRNHQQNMEGGIIEEEFQSEYVVDRTNTLGDAFLGLSVGCAKCHDHKYDPISQKNYYELYSFFNNVKEAGQISWDDAMPTPALMLPTPEQEEVVAFIRAELNQKKKSLVDTRIAGQVAFNSWINKGDFKTLANKKIPRKDIQAKFSFKGSSLTSEIHPKDKFFLTLDSRNVEKTVFVNGGETVKLDGDAWLDCNTVGVFRKSDPFSIGISVKIPEDFRQGVIFHKGIMERLYNFKGFHLFLNKDGTLEANMVHTAPSNAITKVSKKALPTETWIHLTLTYDGSSLAKGLNVFYDGKPMEMETTMDQLTKDIHFNMTPEPGLQVGGWGRGFGFKNGEVDDITVYTRTLTNYEIAVLAGQSSWDVLANKSPNSLKTEEKEILADYFFSAIHLPSLVETARLQEQRRTLADSIENIQEIMVMQEMLNPKQAYVLERGNYDSRGEKVFPNTPENILPFPEDLPKNRYGLAQWLTNPNHPLTSRVVVNRFWQNLFGVGLVKTAEDFGNQGDLPSHPKLLDYLALEFIASGWDVKKLVKEMVMSATYQQDSYASQEKLDADYNNRFLARGPTNRLTAEMIRDNALAASGLLKRTIGGKSVKPYQPEGLWAINNATYTADKTDEVYRRSLYVIVKRSVPNPTLSTFDATSRSFCTVRRQETNTPLQALVTLNDPTFVEASKVLGEKMTQIKDEQKGIVWCFKSLTGKSPSKNELKLLLDLRKVELEKFTKYPNKSKGWLNAGYYEIDINLDARVLAANAVVANVIMNSDAVITKR